MPAFASPISSYALSGRQACHMDAILAVGPACGDIWRATTQKPIVHAGYPFGLQNPLAGGTSEQMNGPAERVWGKLAALWQPHLADLSIHAPDMLWDQSPFLLTTPHPNLHSLKIKGSTKYTRYQTECLDEVVTYRPDFFPARLYGRMNPNFVTSLSGLEVLHDVSHKALYCIDNLAHLTGLTELVLADTGFHRWPEALSSITGLKSLTITQPRPSNCHVCGIVHGWSLSLPASLSTFHYSLTRLVLDYHAVVVNRWVDHCGSGHEIYDHVNLNGLSNLLYLS